MNIIWNPKEHWLENIREGNKVWLVKEQREALVRYPYEPPTAERICGRIGIWVGNYVQDWYIDSNGNGINGSALMKPIDGHYSENPDPIPEPAVRQMERMIDKLYDRIENLEKRIYNLSLQPKTYYYYTSPLSDLTFTACGKPKAVEFKY